MESLYGQTDWVQACVEKREAWKQGTMQTRCTMAKWEVGSGKWEVTCGGAASTLLPVFSIALERRTATWQPRSFSGLHTQTATLLMGPMHCRTGN